MFNGAKEYIGLGPIFFAVVLFVSPHPSRQLSLAGYTERKKTQRGKDGGSYSTG
jgi:hypothetical protein